MLDCVTLTDLVANKAQVVGLDAHGSVADGLNAMREHQVTALCVFGKPGHWLGAGNSSICVADKQLLGLVSILDIILYLSRHIANEANPDALLKKTHISDVLGQNTESLTLWVAATSNLKLALEPLSKGVHRVLVPIFPTGAQKAQHPTPSSYKLCTQSDIITYFQPLLKTEPFQSLASQPISKFASSGVVCALRSDPIMPTLSSLANSNLMAVPIVDRDGVLADTLSANDFRTLLEKTDHRSERVLKALVLGHVTIGEYLKEISSAKPRPLIGVVSGNTSFSEAVDRVCEHKIHRLWIVDSAGVPVGVLSLGDMIRAIREML
ncbi:hypothetical protein BJ741DRAFT_593584 [Chytriomyces cf. hyalinus JEL632]|nr:hypothetical protein BJ741DRAFT_593584 [Chytriomyces cf. hyalinus JEL632]